MKHFVKLFVGILVLFFSCKKIHIPTIPTIKDIDIYIAGNVGVDITPFVMLNGQLNLIETGAVPKDKTQLKDFFLSNGKRYSLLNFYPPYDHEFIGAYTIDQQIHYLPPYFNGSILYSFVENKNIYLAGYHTNGVEAETFVLKNGTLVHQFDWYTIGPVKDMFVSNGDVYMLFLEGNDYYKNGNSYNFNNTGKRFQNVDLFVKDNYVYITAHEFTSVAGVNKSVGAYWINNQYYDLPTLKNYQFPRKIVEQNQNVYVLSAQNDDGSFKTQNIYLYKNGVPQELSYTGEYALANDLQIYNGEVYALVSVMSDQPTANVYKNTKLIASYPLDDIYFLQGLKLQIGKKNN